MAVGIYSFKGQVDMAAGQAAAAVRDAFTMVENFKGWLDTQTDQDLEDLGHQVDDIASMRSSFVDLGKLKDIFRGNDVQATPYNFRTFSKLLGG